ncbi:unnamed protein product [Eruca vesicaria subsp. sativa]|uniref:Uncharacterized protein n=1 Tax=Eruca vesicaria subsp. sativa TaxID=29727 RepID=A0ABC8KU58_ERUVS|nr:unnamed protein product [Eruca vesicaria subsp. sativa]
MASSLAKSNDKDKNKITIRQETETPDFVSTHLYIKRIPPTQALDRDVVLGRIRQRQRASKVRSVFQLLFGFPFLSKKHEGYNDHDEDDAFTVS